MNLLKLVFGLFLLIPVLTSAKPQVYLDYKIYYTLDNKPYIETLLQFISPSYKFLANENGDLVSSVEITQIFKEEHYIILTHKVKMDLNMISIFSIKKNARIPPKHLVKKKIHQIA
jgi:hypothetical protein